MRKVFEHMTYGCDAARADQRAILSVRQGDLVLLYDMDERSLYGPFMASDPYYSTRPLWGKGKWPFRVSLTLWQSRIGIVDSRNILHLYLSIKNNLVTLRDIDDLHNRFLHPLLWKEASLLLTQFFMRAKFKPFQEIVGEQYSGDISPESKSDEIPLRDYLCKVVNEKKGNLPEYVLEGLLLTDPLSLGMITGAGYMYAYNQVFTYQNRFLDIMTVHMIGNEITKMTILELKSYLRDANDMNKALDALLYYMYTFSDKLNIDSKLVYGHIIAQKINTQAINSFRKLKEHYSRIYNIDEERIFLDLINVKPKECNIEIEPIM